MKVAQEKPMMTALVPTQSFAVPTAVPTAVPIAVPIAVPSCVN